MSQFLRADRELWTRVADKVRSNLRPDKNDVLPVDAALEELYTSASVVFHVLPLPAASGAGSTNKRKTPDEEPTKKPQPTGEAAVGDKEVE